MDLKGLPCPMPTVKVSKGIKQVEIGRVIEAQTNGYHQACVNCHTQLSNLNHHYKMGVEACS